MWLCYSNSVFSTTGVKKDFALRSCFNDPSDVMGRLGFSDRVSILAGHLSAEWRWMSH